jgi:DNA-binding transcriptional regulator YiaG
MSYKNQGTIMLLNEEAARVYGRTIEELLAENAENAALLAQQHAEMERQHAEMERQHAETEQQILRMRDVLHLSAPDIAMILNKPVEYIQSVLDKDKQ